MPPANNNPHLLLPPPCIVQQPTIYYHNIHLCSPQPEKSPSQREIKWYPVLDRIRMSRFLAVLPSAPTPEYDTGR